MNSIFPLIPIKLIFLAATIYIWKQLFKHGLEKQQTKAAKMMLAAGVLSIVLSVISVGKIYPYGVAVDLLVFATATTLFMTLPKSSFPLRLLATLVLAIPIMGPLAYLLHYIVVGGAMNKDSFIAVYQTTGNEAFEYLSTFTSVVAILPVIALLILLAWVGKHEGKTSRTLPTQVAIKLIATSVFLIALAPIEKGLFSHPVKVYISYIEEIQSSKERLSSFNARDIKKSYTATKDEKGEVYVVIVGESLNKHHMSVYGYPLNTTPELKKLQQQDDLYIAANSYSNYPGTMAALSYALTEANQKNQKTYLESVGLVEVLNDAGFITHWLGNQPLSNSYDMILGLIAKEAQDVQLTFDIEFHSMSHKNHKPDGVLLPLYSTKLDQLDDQQSHVIFVHLMGNHTNYCERYPEEYNRYEVSALDAAWLHIFKGGLGHSRECYDNSVLYNDFVVSEIITGLRQSLGEQGVGGVLYFADHSEDIKRGVGHSTANFSYDMVESPAIMWLSEGYKQKHPEKTSSLVANQSAFFPNDFIFDTVLGMTNTQIRGDIYCEHCDLFSSKYRLPAKEATTLHGKKPYIPVKEDFSLIASD